MGKQKKTTNSGRRFVYSSFRERIDAIKINKPLSRKSNNGGSAREVEISNFYNSYEHWKEINVTSSFVEFIDKNEGLFQTLAQLIYHKDKIFNDLIFYLTKEKNVELTYQPLLDLLSQFVHDLGEDFYVDYYQKTINVLIELSIIHFENSNILEWIFNCMSFIFKFTASILCENLVETFELLLPLLKMKNAKSHLQRFSSESLSFLIRKIPTKSLKNFMEKSFEIYDTKENGELGNALVIIYSESIKSVSNTLHSKSPVILANLVEFATESSIRKNTVVCEILLNIINYASPESLTEIYELVLNILSNRIDNGGNKFLISKNLISLVFSQSGKKITNWNLILQVTEKLMESSEDCDNELHKSITYLLVLIMRNCDLQELTKFHVKIFKYVLSSRNGDLFLPFIDSGLMMVRDRTILFGNKYLQDFIKNNFTTQRVKLAYFLTKWDNDSKSSGSDKNFDIVIPYELNQTIKLELAEIKDISDTNALKEIYWRLLILKNSEQLENSDDLINILRNILVGKTISEFGQDVVGLLLQVLSDQTFDSKTIVFKDLIAKNFSKFHKSSYFLKGLQLFLEKMDDHLFFEKNRNFFQNEFLLEVAENLSLPSHEIRYLSLSIILTTLNRLSIEISPLISQCHLIEDIPLTLENGRDIQLRVRNLSLEYQKSSIDNLVSNVVPRYLIGLLSAKFSPAWQASNEAIKNISGKSSDIIWKLCHDLLINDYSSNQETESYTSEEDMNFDIDYDEWLIFDYRLKDNFSAVYKIFSDYSNVDLSVVDYMKNERAKFDYSETMRSQIIKLLINIPDVAERNAEALVPLMLHEASTDDEGDEEVDVEPSSTNWSLKDRNLLLELFQEFKNLNNIYRSSDVYNHLLVLLSNRSSHVQRLSLNCILKYKNKHVFKYRDNLLNLLDDNAFRDEVTKFVTQDSEINQIEAEDVEFIMPLVLRILYGRAQTVRAGGVKQGRRFAVFNILPNLKNEHIIEFLKLGSSMINYQQFFDNPVDSILEMNMHNEKLFKRQIRFVNLLSDVIHTLRNGFSDVLITSIKPLLYSLILSQYSLNKKEELTSANLEKTIRNVRTIGMRCLSELFAILGKTNFSWKDYISIIYDRLILPRFNNFTEENLQQPSSLLKLIISWSNFTKNFEFLYLDDFRPAREILSLLLNSSAKESVLSEVFEFCSNIVQYTSLDDKFVELVTIVVETCLLALPGIFNRDVNSKDVNSKAINLLLSLVNNGYIQDFQTKKALIDSLTFAFDKPQQQVEMKDKANILKSLSSLLNDYDCSLDEISPLYKSLSKYFKIYTESKIRLELSNVLVTIGEKFSSRLNHVSTLVSDLNSFSEKRLNEPDFKRRLDAFKEINEISYLDFDELQWIPIVYNSLFFINDEIELSLRTNATYTLCRFIDCFSAKDSAEEASKFLHILKDVILPHLRIGLRTDKEIIQTEYISLLAHIVKNAKYFDDFADMKFLLFNGDEEADFFLNINHIQLHRRQRAVRRLKEIRIHLSGNSISHYILPIIEHYAFSDIENQVNIKNETVECIGSLLVSLNWKQFRAVFKRYISYLNKPELLRNSVNLVVTVSASFLSCYRSKEQGGTEGFIEQLPSSKEEIDSYIMGELMPPIMKSLTLRDDETTVYRIPLSEALTSLVICLSEEKRSSELPAILTSVCQVMRSRSEELRDAVRKNLARMSKTLGSKYFKFILKELKTALKRGSQIHVLSFTIHYLLVVMSDSLSHGDLDESSELLADIIMEDIFGAAGQEKDAEGYTSKMKEVKHKKSFDTAELLSANISLASFNCLITPVKLLLRERIALKTRNKLDELLRRYSLGLNRNEESSTRDILLLCYQLHNQSKELLVKPESKSQISGNKNGFDVSSDHFLVKLSSKTTDAHMEYSLYMYTLQKFTLDLLRVVISRNETLFNVESLQGFVPLLEESLRVEDEGVMISSIKVLNLIIKLPFSEDIENTFKSCARKALNVIKDSPSTNSELCQACLRFLATLIRQKQNITLKSTALSYILLKIQPDLEEPNKQGLAFNFLKSLISQRIMIPEIYDTMDKVSHIMITNHNKEIRDMARSVYFQFLMDYDQSRGRLEKQFKFLVNNLEYPGQQGRQSVMELLHLILVKSSQDLLVKLSTSFFVALTMVMISDDLTRCREMAIALISTMLKKLKGNTNISVLENYILAWLNQYNKNSLLLRCGLQSYKLYVDEVGLDVNKELDNLAMKRVRQILELSKNDEIRTEDDIEWELIYSSLTLFSTIASKKADDSIFHDKSIWEVISNCLLYPHTWIRLISCRLIGNYLTKIDNLSNVEVQQIAYRLLRQLGAPSTPESLGAQVVNNLAVITMYWEKNKSPYELYKKENDKEALDEEDEEVPKYKYATEWAAVRVSVILRKESNPKESLVTKKCCIQYIAILIRVLSVDELVKVAENLILPLYNFQDSNHEDIEELKNLSLEALSMMEKKIGISEYTKRFSNVRQFVLKRRQERKTKRSQMAVTAPDISSRRKIKKHERFREKRKHTKDENGYYKHKKKKTERR
ncbi:hypothetical protein PACTADRAFT_47545 [Pachysolen tannophilus NRRL Y-2460]|uniref:Uncharacterized protein n=1 Tax=Pachysolen tannophilus NRRL Y-2460 TaxID=669874 RepID=A0A1E4U0X1_PACTA|nr:hypothetical protein PACTADRAFT_47545 [Pachysolen tannophilus NRRL Y-2460]